jgi:hypothetical protein
MSWLVMLSMSFVWSVVVALTMLVAVGGLNAANHVMARATRVMMIVAIVKAKAPLIRFAP